MTRGLGLVVWLAVAACAGGGAGDQDLAEPSAADLAVADEARAPDLAMPDLSPPPPSFVYVSGYSSTIRRYVLDHATGTLSATGTTAATGQPSWLAIAPGRTHLYAIDEAGSMARAFAIDGSTGALSAVGVDRPVGGTGPAHGVVDATGKWLLVASYGSGDVGVLAIQGDGSLVVPSALFAGDRAHQVVLGPGFALVPCLGKAGMPATGNYLAQYAFDAATGALTPQTPATVAAPATDSGPRHLALHPDGQHAYLIEETASMMSAYAVDAAGGVTFQQRLSTRAAGATGTNTGAEVQVHPSGKWLYGSNRGDDDLVRYALATDGTMTLAGHTPTGGSRPRHFTIDQTGRWLLVANQSSNEVRVLAIDAATGDLTATSTVVTVTAPAFVGIVARP